MAQASRGNHNDQRCQADWNLRPSIGTWLQSTVFQVDAVDGKVCWSAQALAPIPSDDELGTLETQARDLTVVGLTRVQRFLLCSPPRKPTGWTRTRCVTCLAKFDSRIELFAHLRRFGLSDKRCCMMNSEERHFWATLPSDEFSQTAHAAAQLGVGYRFFPAIRTWLEAAWDASEVCKRLSCLALLPSTQLALGKADLAEWLKLHKGVLVSLVGELDDKPQILVLDLAAEAPSLLHSFVVALLSTPHVESRLQTLLSTGGATLVGITEGVLEAATHEASHSLVHKQLPQLLATDFGLITRLATVEGGPKIGVRALQLMIRLLREWNADEGSLLDFIPTLVALVGNETQLLRSLVIALCANPVESRLQTLLNMEGESLVCMTEGVLEAATHEVSRAVVHAQLPPLLTPDFGLVTRLASSASDRKIGIRALQVITKLLREWQADEGSLLIFIPTILQSVGSSLPLDPGATMLAAVLRCLSQRSADVPNQLVGDDAVVSSVVNLLFSSIDRNRRHVPFVIELAHAVLGDEDEGYETRLAAFGVWGITERELELPGQAGDGAPELVLNVGEDVLRSTFSQLLGAKVESLRRGRFKVKFIGGIGADYGGLRRAFLARAGAQLCTARLNLLLPAARGYFQLSPLPGLLGSQDLRDNPKHWCQFLGRLFGLAVVHDEPLGLLLIPSLCKLLAGEKPCFSDLQYVDANWYQSLSSLSGHDSTVDDILDGLRAECTSKPAFIFDALVSHIEGAGEFKLDLAEMLLRAAATNPQRAAAVQAATNVLQFASLPEQERLLAVACSLPRSGDVDQFIKLVQSQCGTVRVDESTLAKADDCTSSGAVLAPLPPGLERDKSSVAGCGITAGEPLNSKNIENFKEALAKKLLLDNLQPHLKYVCDEFHAVVSAARQNKTWEEVQRVIAGAPVDVQLWRRLTTYNGGHSNDSEVITWWWNMLEEGGDFFRRRVFTFATGYASMPPSGIRFTLELADDATRLPTARTCTSTLYLPVYSSREVLSQKLEWALTEEGFQLV